MNRILKEPLLHFVALGAALFVAYGFLSRSSGTDAPRQITVTLGQVEHLATGFARTWQRPPTESELKSLVDDWVRDEIATREAIALGLDKDDSVIRKRLRQKLDFVSDDIAAQNEPTEAELGSYFQEHSEVFRLEPRLSFSQVYFNPAQHAEQLSHDVSEVLARLQQSAGKADISALGDSFLLEQEFQSVPLSDIAKQFGDEFTAALSGLSPGQWQGPIESGYGVHLVMIKERTEGRMPAFPDVRDAVRREWENARRLEGNERFYQELLKRYTVTIESPEPVKAQQKLEGS